MRVDDATWDQFGQAAEMLDSERATLLRNYIDWVLGKPGAPEPRQAPTGSDS